MSGSNITVKRQNQHLGSGSPNYGLGRYHSDVVDGSFGNAQHIERSSEE